MNKKIINKLNKSSTVEVEKHTVEQSELLPRVGESSKLGQRRMLLASITAASVAGLPSQWKRPIVDSILLPAHAQTSVMTTTTSSSSSSSSGSTTQISSTTQATSNTTLVSTTSQVSTSTSQVTSSTTMSSSSTTQAQIFSFSAEVNCQSGALAEASVTTGVSGTFTNVFFYTAEYRESQLTQCSNQPPAATDPTVTAAFFTSRTESGTAGNTGISTYFPTNTSLTSDSSFSAIGAPFTNQVTFTSTGSAI